MMSAKKLLCRVLSAVTVMSIAGTVHATPISFTDNITFNSLDQSMWAEGKSASFSAQTFLGTQWGTYDGTSASVSTIGGIIGSDCETIACLDTRTGATAEIKSSGQLGVVVHAGGGGGAIDTTVPVRFSVTTPVGDIAAGTRFTVTAAGSVLGGASFITHAPSFNAGVDGVINLDSHLSATACFFELGCTSDGTDLNVRLGQFRMIGVDTSKTKPFSIGGLRFDLPGLNAPFTIHTGPAIIPILLDITPGIGQVTLFTPKDKSGGTVSGDTLSLATDQDALRLTLSIPGIAEAAGGLEVDVLKNSISVPGLFSLGYVLFDAEAGLNYGMHQLFSLDTNPVVELTFSGEVKEFDVPFVDHYAFHFCPLLDFFCDDTSSPTVFTSPTPKESLNKSL